MPRMRLPDAAGAENPPFSFLAACIDWVNYKRTGRGYVSHAPVAQDGTCSGLQHYSAILRDPVAGAATNLLPSNAPKDIYKVVADRTLELLQAVPVGNEHYRRAQQWIASGLVTRKLTKQPVMTLPYGSTRYSSQRSILAYIDELRGENPSGFFFSPEEAAGACAYLNGVVYTAIEQTVLAAPKAMKWLQRVAEVASEAGRPLIWITPSGMPVVQEYFNQEYKRVTIKMTGESVLTLPSESGKDEKEETGGKKRIDVTVKYDGSGIDAEKQIQGIAPNFIHSMDASAMVLAIREAKRHGIDSFALIHDSFGTHAADSGCLADSLRKAFVDMYESLDVLEDFREEVALTLPEEARAALPQPPEKGDLDLQSVKESKEEMGNEGKDGMHERRKPVFPFY